MSAIKRQLAQLNLVAGTSSLAYTPPVSQIGILKEVIVCNSSAIDTSFTMGIKGVEAMGSSNVIFNKITIAAGTTSILSLSSIIPNGKTLYFAADQITTGGSLNIIASGVEIATTTGKQLATSILPTVSTLLYTAPLGLTTTMYQAMFANVGTASTTISLWMVPPGGSAQDSNLVLKSINCDVGSTVMYSSSTVLLPGSKLFAMAGAAENINLTIDGMEQ